VFRRIANQWTQTQKLHDPQAFTVGEFGTSMSSDAGTVVIGAPAPSSSFTSGSASVWHDDGKSFILQGVLEPPSSPKHRQFGASLAISSDQVIVGAPWTAWPNSWYWGDLQTAQYAGLAHLFEKRDGAWQFWFTTRRTSPVAGEYVGQSVALMPGIAIAGAGQLEPGKALIFGTQPPDCDANGSPDNCDTDCDRNNQADICELMQSPESDCNANATPDVCEAANTYQIDLNQNLLAYGYPYVQTRDFLWLNQFTVQFGGEVITHLAIPWSVFQPAGITITALLYSDPNQDGNPADAIALATVESQVFTEDDDHILPIDLARVAIPSTYIGEAGTSFFVGAMSHIEVGGYPAYADASGPSAGRSWGFSTQLGVMNVQQPGLTSTPYSHSRNWWLRALSLDCNGNGTWDQCDIDSGFSADLNANGIPDECDAPCDGDTVHNGHVDIDDLLIVIDHWDATGPVGSTPSDIAPPGGNGVVDIDDLLVIINAWGPCP
jgi:hypothetical protein